MINLYDATLFVDYNFLNGKTWSLQNFLCYHFVSEHHADMSRMFHSRGVEFVYILFLLLVQPSEAFTLDCDPLLEFYDTVMSMCASCESLCGRGEFAMGQCKWKCAGELSTCHIFLMYFKGLLSVGYLIIYEM